MTSKLRLLVWALALRILPLHAQEEDHSNDNIQDPNSPIVLTTDFHCINIHRTDPTLDLSQPPTKLCPGDPPFLSYNFDIWLSCGFPHDGPERTSPTQYLRATWLSHVALTWHSDSAIIDARYTISQTSWLDMQPSSKRTVIKRSCNPRKSAELNPYWVDFEKGDERDALTWVDGEMEYDKGIRNSVCGKDSGGEKDGPYNMEGFTKGSKTMGGSQKGFATTSSSSLLPAGENSLESVDDGTTIPPLLASTSPDEDTDQEIDTSFFFSAAPSSSFIALQDNVSKDDNNSNDDDEATVRLDPKFFTSRRTRKRTAGVSYGLI